MSLPANLSQYLAWKWPIVIGALFVLTFIFPCPEPHSSSFDQACDGFAPGMDGGSSACVLAGAQHSSGCAGAGCGADFRAYSKALEWSDCWNHFSRDDFGPGRVRRRPADRLDGASCGPISGAGRKLRTHHRSDTWARVRPGGLDVPGERRDFNRAYP